MHKSPLALTDLIRDNDFITWVRRPTPELHLYWARYLEKFPDQKETILQARGYVNLIAEDTGRDLPTLARSQKIWKNVNDIMNSENSKN